MLSFWATIETRGSLERLTQRTNRWRHMVNNDADKRMNALVDRRSGTAAVLETGRALAVLRDQGWRPRRTIVWCSWDAEGIV